MPSPTRMGRHCLVLVLQHISSTALPGFKARPRQTIRTGKAARLPHSTTIVFGAHIFVGKIFGVYGLNPYICNIFKTPYD